MNFLKFNLQSSYQGFLSKKRLEDGYLLGIIYPSGSKMEQGDILVHPEYFHQNENGEITLLKVDEITEERPGKGTYQSEELRPTYRRVKAVRQKFTKTELINSGIIRVEQKYDEKNKKNIDVYRLNAA